MSYSELTDKKTASLDFLSGGGEMGELIRNFDWNKTPLGDPRYWQNSLKTCIRIILTSPQPMFVWWGTEYINIYNDAYRFILGEKHPALGASGNIVWKEIWNEVGARADIVFNNNEGTYDDALLLIMNRYGYDEETYFKFSYNPIPGDNGGTTGLFCVCTEETERIINERYLKTLQVLERLSQKESEQEIYEQAAGSLETNNKDFPFGIFYKINEADQIAIPVSFFGFCNEQSGIPSSIDLRQMGDDTLNFHKAYQTREIVVSENAGLWKKLPKGAWEKEATRFVHIPIFITGHESPIAILSAGLNPFRKFDESYRQFSNMVADRIALEISKVISYDQEKEARRKIEENEEKNRLFIEYAPAAMAMFDKEMRYVSVSKLWMKEYDLTGDIIGKKHYELFPNILQRWKDVHSRSMKGVVEKSDDDYYEKDDGTPVWLKWEVHPWYKAPDEIGGIVIFTENITERKKIQQAIKESEERFRTMANEAPLFVWETDENLQTTYLNKAGLDYFNLEKSARMSELSWKQYIHPDDIEKVLKIMSEAARLHNSYTLEMRLRNGVTNEYRWFLDKGTPRYSSEKFTGFIGTSLDIHDRREAEKELEDKVTQRTGELNRQNILLKQQNHLVKKILDSSVDLIAVYDTDTRIISINQSSLNMMRVKEEDVLDKKLLDILPQMKDKQGYNDLIRAINGETIHNEIYHSPISNRYYENSLIPLKDENDRIYAVLVMAHDNTELITAAERLRQKNKELQSTKSFLEQLIDSSVEYISVLDQNCNYITVNRKFERKTKMSREQLLGKNILEVSPHAKGTDKMECIKKALRGEVTYLAKRRSVSMPDIFVDTYFIPLMIQNEVEGVIIMSRDVTDMVRSEELLQQKNMELQNSIDLLRNQELKDVQKNNFIAMASHELKTPITSIKGYVQLLLNAFDKEKVAEKPLPSLLVRSSLISVDKQITRLTRLISELLDLTKIDTGTLELKKDKFSLNQLAIETIEDILYTNTKHEINLFHDFHADVFADKDRIGQVMINFLTNAIKYSPNCNKIDVTIRQSKKGEIAFSVKDYGIGIDKEEQEKIFERFYRAKGKEEQTYPGFGIGLFIANEFVAKHGGQVWVESERGKGSVFTFTLPIFK